MTRGGERRGGRAPGPVAGVGSFELTLHLYRDFELVTVLADSVRHLPPAATLPSTTPVDDILAGIATLGGAVERGDASAARSIADGTVREGLTTLAEPYRDAMLQILDDLLAVL